MLSPHCCAWDFSRFGEREPLSSCDVLASHPGGFSCRAQALGCAGFSACVSWALGTGSVVVAHRLSSPAACEIFLNQGSNPCPLHCDMDS